MHACQFVCRREQCEYMCFHFSLFMLACVCICSAAPIDLCAAVKQTNEYTVYIPNRKEIEDAVHTAQLNEIYFAC